MGRVLVAGAACALVLSACSWGLTGPAGDVTFTGAVLHGDAHTTIAGATSWWFEYGTSTGYGRATPHQSVDLAGPSAATSVFAGVADLAPGTEYHYRLCTRGGDGYGVCGGDRMFATSGHGSVSGGGAVIPIVVSGTVAIGVDAHATASSTGPGEEATGTAELFPGADVGSGRAGEDSGPVTCLDVVGNRAAIGFTTTGIAGPNPPRVLYVEDNGPTGDRIGFGYLQAPYTDCPTPTADDFPLMDYFTGAGSLGPPYAPVLVTGDFTVQAQP